MEKINLDGMESLIGKSYSSIGDDVIINHQVIQLKKKYNQKNY